MQQVAQHPAKIGKYQVEEFLGGGMSHVYRATDTVLGRRVAIKLLTEEAMADPEAKVRFLQEARLASNIQHENIIAIYDFGEDIAFKNRARNRDYPKKTYKPPENVVHLKSLRDH